MMVEQAGDQCTLGYNFDTKPNVRFVASCNLQDVLEHVFGPKAYAGRLLRLALMLDRSDANCRIATCARGLAASIAYTGLYVSCRRFASRSGRPSLLMALYMHLGSFSKRVIVRLTAGLASWTVCLRWLRWLLLDGERREPNPECHYLRAGRDLLPGGCGLRGLGQADRKLDRQSFSAKLRAPIRRCRLIPHSHCFRCP
jgi:hypothetical protein